MYWILLIFSIACADKLDRTYLPPPGSQYSGGRPEDIQAPLEYAKTNFPENVNYVDNKEFAIGIDRKGPKEVEDSRANISQNLNPKFFHMSTTISPSNDSFFNKIPTNPNYVPNYSPSENLQNEISASNDDRNQNNGGHSSFNMKNKEDNLYLQKQQPVSNIISTTFMPTTVIPNYSKQHTSNKPQNNFNAVTSSYASTTSNPQNTFNMYNIRKPSGRAQAHEDRTAVILNYENVLTPEGYAYTFDTSNGIHADETGLTTNGVKAKGSYSYIGDDGKLYEVVYTADENGFRPRGDHLPTSPPIPDAILKVIEKAIEDKKAGIIDDGSYDENKYGYKKYEKSSLHNMRSPTKPTDKQSNFIDAYNKKIINKSTVNPKTDKIDLNSVSSKSNQNAAANSVKQLPYIKKDSQYTNDNYDSPQSTSDNDKEIGKKNYIYNSEQQFSPKTIENEYNNIVNYKKDDRIEISLPSNLKSSVDSADQYFPAQNEESKKIPTLFFDMNNNGESYQRKTTKIPTPFMTPYVSREDDESQNYDSNEKTFYDEPGHYSEETQSKYNNANHPYDKPNERGEIDINKSDETDFQIVNEGYFYPKATNLVIKPESELSDPAISRTTSVVPFGFPSRSTITDKVNEFRATSTPNTPSMTEKALGYGTSSFPNYSTNSQFRNEYSTTNLPFDFNNGRSTETAPEINAPNLRPSYSPNIDVTIPAISTVKSFIGEDFTGPKRPQSFNPLTGYQY